MKAYLDGEQFGEFKESAVAQAIADGASRAEHRGRMITEVFVDDRRWSNEEIESAPDADSTASEVRLVSADQGQLVSQTLDEAASALAEAADLQQTAADMLDTARQQDAMNALNDAITIWINVRGAAQMCAAALQLDLDSLTIEDETVDTVIRNLGARLTDIRAAVTQDDPVALADTLRFDMPAITQQWRDLLAHLRTHARTGEDT